MRGTPTRSLPGARLARHLAAAALVTLAVAGCRKQTEVVVRLTAMGGTPPEVALLLHRSTPFNDNPTMTPGNVTAVLRRADLELRVVPQAGETVLSLLPSANGPRDLTITASANGYSVMPAGAQEANFIDGAARDIRFMFTLLPPDMGVADQATPRDSSGPGPDLAAPIDGGVSDGKLGG